MGIIKSEKMMICLDCDVEFDDSNRKSDWWKKRYEEMGCCADICNACWKKRYRIDVKNK